jgi:ATP-dependent DNA ligase
MVPMLVREPFHRDGWVYEEKVDGWRMLAYKDRSRVRLVSRNGRDQTRRFADLTAAISKLSARTLVLDGEVAIYDQQLRSRFGEGLGYFGLGRGVARQHGGAASSVMVNWSCPISRLRFATR